MFSIAFLFAPLEKYNRERATSHYIPPKNKHVTKERGRECEKVGDYMCKSWGGSWAWAYLHRHISTVRAYGWMGWEVMVDRAIGSYAGRQRAETTHILARVYCVW